MSEKELSRYYFLKKEVEEIEERLQEFGNGVGSSKIKEVITSHSGVSASIQEKKMQLVELYMERRISALEEYLKIENYISSIEEPEVRVIMEMRFLKLKNWEQIGDELYQDRTTAPKKMRKFLKEQVSHISR